MYIIKNSFRCIGRSLGRNILIGIIVFVIAVSACIGLSIRQAAQNTKEETMSGMNITATISFDRQSMMGELNGSEGGFDKEQFAERIGETNDLSFSEYEKYAKAESVEDFYYSMTASFNGNDDFSPVSTDTESETDSDSDNKRPNVNFGGGFGGFGGFGGLGGKQMNNGDFTVIGYSSDAAMTDFVRGTATITKGSVFEEGTKVYDCIISEELATYNDLGIGRAIKLTNPNDEDEEYTLYVVGIYKDSSSNDGFQRAPGSDPANKIYMSATALESIIAASEKVSTTVTDETTGREYETAVTSSFSPTYVFSDVESYNNFEEEARNLGLDDSYKISSQDVSNFENSLVPLNTLSTMAGWFLIVILVIGAVILIVLNIFNVRERKYEIGVLMAIGMKKINVAKQFLIEAFAITLVAVMLGVVIGGVSSVPVTNALLENQIASAQSESVKVEENFGRGERPNLPSGNFGGGSMTPPDNGNFKGIENMFGEKAANYVSEINSAMNFTVVLQMLGIAVLLTIVAGGVGVLFVMRYDPLKILANRD
ncbi:MAG: ABC transporter permease [Clostridia bacterium]|nr:ABC transporter permease [Clostridia bacterium]